MKTAFISDIHGNALALEAVLEDIEQKNVDEVLVLGDICYRGPEPKRALELVQALDTTVIKGNADEWVVRGIKQGEVPDQVLQKMKIEQEWTVSKLDGKDIQYLAELPTELTYQLTDNIKIFGFHATPDSLFEVVKPDVDDETIETKLMHKSVADMYVYGHIHLPYVRFIKGKCMANLGSVGLPFDGLNQSSYLIVEGENDQFNVSIQRVKYDVDKVIEQLHQNDYPNISFVSHVLNKGSLT